MTQYYTRWSATVSAHKPVAEMEPPDTRRFQGLHKEVCPNLPGIGVLVKHAWATIGDAAYFARLWIAAATCSHCDSYYALSLRAADCSC